MIRAMFFKEKTFPNYELHCCALCKRLAEMRRKNGQQCPPLGSIRVIGEHFLTDPDRLHHLCIHEENDASDWAKIIATFLSTQQWL